MPTDIQPIAGLSTEQSTGADLRRAREPAADTLRQRIQDELR